MIADRGYYKGPELLDCHKAGVHAYVPKPMTSVAKARGRFSKADFVYIASRDEYRCPAGQRLRRGSNIIEDGMTMHSYARYGCGSCPLKARCTTGNGRRVKRWEHEDVWIACNRAWIEPPRR